MIYVGAMLALHHTMYFLLESLSMISLVQLIVTILFSSLLSSLLVWPIVGLFLKKIVR
jgi:hypothetical protein